MSAVELVMRAFSSRRSAGDRVESSRAREWQCSLEFKATGEAESQARPQRRDVMAPAGAVEVGTSTYTGSTPVGHTN